MRNYVYILQCRDGSYYTGWTNNIFRRLKAHNEGKAGAKCTRSRRPVSLAYAECFPTREAAMSREYAIKKLTHAQKKELAGERFVMGRIFYLIGKSASGKNKIYDSLIGNSALDLKPLVIYTTRPVRSGETEGVEYHFTDEAGLALLKKSGKVIEERAYDTVCGIWKYFTVDDDTIDLSKGSYLAIGTLASYRKLCAYYGTDTVIPLYVETEDGLRLARALKRESKQSEPKYEEMCRRFLADQKDFSETKLSRAGIKRRFLNNGSLSDCIDEITEYIMKEKGGN